MKILIPVKVAEENPVITTGLNFACHTNSTLTFLHIVDTTPIKRSFLSEPKSMKGYLKKRGEEILEMAEEYTRGCGIEVMSKLLEGIPEEVIISESMKFDFIVMRSRVFSSEDKLGSVVERVIGKVNKPVMLVSDEKKEFETCLVPVDGSEASLKSLYDIKKRKDTYKFKRIIILHVHRATREEVKKEDEELSPEGTGEMDIYKHRVVLEAAENIVKGAVEELKAEALHISHGNIAEAIIEFGKKKKVDIIFMGSKGKSGISRIILGSVSRKVASYSKVPVVIFPQDYIP